MVIYMIKLSAEHLKEVSDVYDGSLFQAILDEKSNDNYKYTDLTMMQIYTNNLIDNVPGHTEVRLDGIEYRINEKHYRSNKFESGTDVLITGCSHTYGVGLTEDFRWGNILSDRLGLTHSNLGVPGSGVTKQIRDIFAYFKEFGHPKYIFAVFPVFNRFEIITNPKYLKHGAFDRISENHKHPTPYHEPFRQTANICMIPSNPKFLSQPLIAEDVIQSEIPQFYSSMYIQMLQQYCDLAGIKFAWVTWHQKQYDVLSKVNDEYPGTYHNMINAYNDRWIFNDSTQELDYFEYGEKIDCHLEYKDIFGDEFHAGMDRINGMKYAHWGAHRNLHIAEAFQKFFNENWLNND